MSDVEVFFNPRCSKCRSVKGLLEANGVEADYIRYLEETPSKEELEKVLQLLGTDEPLSMMRVDEPEFDRLGLQTASREELLDAMVRHPILIQRPIVIREGRAVIGRPPERVLELFE